MAAELLPYCADIRWVLANAGAATCIIAGRSLVGTAASSYRDKGDVPLNIELIVNETRVLGCLLQKLVAIKDQCSLRLTAFTNARNQKSNRDSVMSSDSGVVQRTSRHPEDKHLAASNKNVENRVEKYNQRRTA